MPPLARWLITFVLVLAGLSGTSRAAPAPSVVANCTESDINNALGHGGLVTIDCGGPATISFTSPITLTKSAILDGGGIITLTGHLVTRLFIVPSGFSFTLRNIVLSRGYSGASNGGAIANHGRLTLENSTIQLSAANASNSGGAIFTDGPLTLTNSTLLSNAAGNAGAVFANTPGARVAIIASRLISNTAFDATLGDGGAIWVGGAAQVSLLDGQVSSNTAHYGGGIYVSFTGVLTLTSASGLDLSGNSATADGGAIYTEQGSSTRLQGVSLSHNHAPGRGGAMASLGALAVDFGVFRSNQGGSGGGLAAGLPSNQKSLGPVPITVARSSFISNTANQEGGGLYVSNETTVITVTDTAFEGNQATDGGGGLTRYEALLNISRASFTRNRGNDGGGLFVTYNSVPNATGYVTVRDSTFSGNTGTNSAGAVLNQDLLQLISVTLKDNSSGFNNLAAVGVNGRLRGAVLQNTGANCEGAAPSDDASNFATDTTCAFPTSQQGTLLNPQLGPLATDPNGFTAYYLPLAGSPLIDHGPSNCAPADQRGIPRLGACDIGAVEFGGLLPRLFLALTQR